MYIILFEDISKTIANVCSKLLIFVINCSYLQT